MNNKRNKPKVANNIDSIISQWNNTDYTVFNHHRSEGELLVHNRNFTDTFYLVLSETDSLRLIDEVNLIPICKDLVPGYLGIGDYATREKLISILRHLNKKIETRTEKITDLSRQIEVLNTAVSHINELIKEYGK